MSLRRRIQRLERIRSEGNRSRSRAFDDILVDARADGEMLAEWLAVRGYHDALEAVAAGESGPAFRTCGWSLTVLAGFLRDPIEEAILAAGHPGIPLWYGIQRGWCVPHNGRLTSLSTLRSPEQAVERFRALTANPIAGQS